MPSPETWTLTLGSLVGLLVFIVTTLVKTWADSHRLSTSGQQVNVDSRATAVMREQADIQAQVLQNALATSALKQGGEIQDLQRYKFEASAREQVYQDQIKGLLGQIESANVKLEAAAVARIEDRKLLETANASLVTANQRLEEAYTEIKRLGVLVTNLSSANAALGGTAVTVELPGNPADSFLPK